MVVFGLPSSKPHLAIDFWGFECKTDNVYVWSDIFKTDNVCVWFYQHNDTRTYSYNLHVVDRH